MKISLEWLREYVDYGDGPEKLEELLTNAGFEVEETIRVGDDWVLDIEITSNRPDCLGHIGIAREVAAATGKKMHLPAVEFTEVGKNVTEWTSVANQAPQLCSRYTARIIADVSLKPSPDWMARRLEAIGIRAINNIVDITNYVQMEVGQPLHGFDYDLLNDGRIVVRQARQGEKIETIDHTQIELADYMLVIADGANPVALAGIMGGATSEVNDNTKTILLESAHFAPLCIRRSSRALTLSSESSFRFERNVDIAMVEWASRRAAALLADLADGKIAPGVIDVYDQPQQPAKVQMRLSRMNSLLGVKIDSQRAIDILEGLGFAPEHNGQEDTVICTVPSWRADVYREVDLIEEVIRIHGFQHIPTNDAISITVKTPDPIQHVRQRVATTLNSCGLFETINVNFIEDRHVSLFAEDDFEPLRVKDLAKKSNNALRHTLLPSLLAARKRNQDAGNGRCDLYEFAAVHKRNDTNNQPQEDYMLGLISDGDFREVRGIVEAIVAGLNKAVMPECKPCDLKWASTGSGAVLHVGQAVIGVAGQVSQDILNAFDLDNDVCMSEIYFEQLRQLQDQAVQIKPLPRFPGIMRDLSLVLDEQITWAQIQNCVNKHATDELQRLDFVGIYRGKGVEKGKKSLTLSMLFRREQETLTHQQADQFQATILASLSIELNAQLRA